MCAYLGQMVTHERARLSRKISNQRGQTIGNEVIPIKEEKRNLGSENEV